MRCIGIWGVIVRRIGIWRVAMIVSLILVVLGCSLYVPCASVTHQSFVSFASAQVLSPTPNQLQHIAFSYQMQSWKFLKTTKASGCKVCPVVMSSNSTELAIVLKVVCACLDKWHMHMLHAFESVCMHVWHEFGFCCVNVPMRHAIQYGMQRNFRYGAQEASRYVEAIKFAKESLALKREIYATDPLNHGACHPLHACVAP